MLTRKVIAGPIKNLTDARYFAAWMVDYMSFDLRANSTEYIGPEKIKEIVEWVEGPLILGDISGHDDPAIIFEFKDALGLDGFISDDASILNSLQSYSHHLFFKAQPSFEK